MDNATIVLLDLTLVTIGLLVVVYSRTKDHITWWSLLVYPAFWGGGLAASHLFLVVGLGLVDLAGGTDLVTATIYYLCCAFWGGLLVHLHHKLEGGW